MFVLPQCVIATIASCRFGVDLHSLKVESQANPHPIDQFVEIVAYS